MPSLSKHTPHPKVSIGTMESYKYMYHGGGDIYLPLVNIHPHIRIRICVMEGVHIFLTLGWGVYTYTYSEMDMYVYSGKGRYDRTPIIHIFTMGWGVCLLFGEKYSLQPTPAYLYLLWEGAACLLRGGRYGLPSPIIYILTLGWVVCLVKRGRYGPEPLHTYYDWGGGRYVPPISNHTPP